MAWEIEASIGNSDPSAHAGETAEPAHGAGALACIAERSDVAPVGFAMALRDEAVEGTAEGLVHGNAEDALRGLIEHDDAMGLVDGDDGIHRRVDDALELACVGRISGDRRRWRQSWAKIGGCVPVGGQVGTPR